MAKVFKRKLKPKKDFTKKIKKSHKAIFMRFSHSLFFHNPMTAPTTTSTTGMVINRMPIKSIMAPVLIIFVIGT